MTPIYMVVLHINYITKASSQFNIMDILLHISLNTITPKWNQPYSISSETLSTSSEEKSEGNLILVLQSEPKLLYINLRILQNQLINADSCNVYIWRYCKYMFYSNASLSWSSLYSARTFVKQREHRHLSVMFTK